MDQLTPRRLSSRSSSYLYRCDNCDELGCDIGDVTYEPGAHMTFELPPLLPPDDLPLERADGKSLTVERCQLLGHNVAPDGKADPIDIDDPYFVYVYQHGDAFFVVRGLNPEMMEGRQLPAGEAEKLLTSLPYRIT
jgi:hypothetical protein